MSRCGAFSGIRAAVRAFDLGDDVVMVDSPMRP